MMQAEYAGPPATAPLPVLFLMADTGGGHRNAARAVGESLELAYPGGFAPVLCDPLGGPGSARLLRWVTGLYGPAVRLAPWLWGAAYYVSNSRPAMAVLWRTAFTAVNRPVAAAVTAARPAVIVSCHPLTGRAAVLAARRPGRPVPVISVVTDLVAVHASWRFPPADPIAVPSAAAAQLCGLAAPCIPAGLPVELRAQSGPLPAGERTAIRRRLGLPDDGFVVLLAGGGEGCGGLARRAAAILREVS